jgi:large subunit ribosomal protein L32e
MSASYPRPRFRREESWRYKRVKPNWRSPRGKTSRVRRSKKGWPAVVKIGYSRPKATRGLHPSGLREVPVWRPGDLEKIDEKMYVARIAHTVGERKRVLLIEEAKKRNIRILNPGVKKAPETELAPEPAPETSPAEEVTPEPKKESAKPERKAKSKAAPSKRKTRKDTK